MNFQTWLNDTGASALTVEGYVRDVTLFGAWLERSFGQGVTPETVTRLAVKLYLGELEEQRYAPATLNRKMEAVRAYVRFGQAAGDVRRDYDPLSGIERFAEGIRPPNWLERDEDRRLMNMAETLFNGAKSDYGRTKAARDWAALALMRYAGLRVAEVCVLEIADIQLAERMGMVLVRHGKGDKQRQVELNEEAVMALMAWLGQRPQGGEALFIGKRGEALEPRGVQRMVAEMGERARVSGVTPHRLRHTFAKRMLDNGVTMHIIQRLMGHERMETTARYTEPGRADRQKAVAHAV